MLVCGVDEAGRGPLAGSVFAAAVILGDDHGIVGLADSKQLTAARRDVLFEQIRERALAWCIASASVAEIDQLNILKATMLAMHRAVSGLTMPPALALIDGNRVPPGLPCKGQSIVRGDALEPCISAASILAKVSRDRELVALDAQFPGYGFAIHKGYPTPAHLAALVELGPTPVHRTTFAPVRAQIQARQGTFW